MKHIYLNALGASAGAGLTYLYNVVPGLASLPDVKTTLALQPSLRSEFQDLPNVSVPDFDVPAGTARRFWFEQRELPKLIRRSGADLLISAGNFALCKSPVPQILLSGNSLYTSQDFYRDLRRRGEYGMWLDTKLRGIFARKSVQWADCTVAPSRSFADELQRWTGNKVEAVYHGFNPGVFFGENSPLPDSVRAELHTTHDCLRLLFVSHYNYYRNFETLFKAVAILKQRLSGSKVRLYLTCTLDDEQTPGAYRIRIAGQCIRDLGINNEVIQLGAIPYTQLHTLYRSCDIYVTAAYAETFAHPLVEAMACGLPIVASDIPVHKEICSGSARFFPRFSPESLANETLATLANLPAKANSGKVDDPRPVRFSWDSHIKSLLDLASQLQADATMRQPQRAVLAKSA
jgi:glycosyltransferase involved in cell wall biosynthesis